jgi:very-short-patch-repair endonuclease
MISTAQLIAAGVDRGAIKWRVQRGRLHPYHRGVYSVGHTRLTARARLWAAVLACGGPEAAVVSHRSAGALWELIRAPSGPVDVVTLRESYSTKAIRVHRTASLRPDDITIIEDLPLTSPTRTLIDLADVLSPQRLERACHRAEILRVLDAAVLGQRLAQLPGRRTKALSAALESLAPGPQVTRRELEERMLALIAQFGLPRPRVNAVVEGHEVDFYWPAAKLIVETDGAATHLTATAFEHDRARDAELTVAGYRVVRFTWRQLRDRPHTMAHTLRALLA